MLVSVLLVPLREPVLLVPLREPVLLVALRDPVLLVPLRDPVVLVVLREAEMFDGWTCTQQLQVLVKLTLELRFVMLQPHWEELLGSTTYPETLLLEAFLGRQEQFWVPFKGPLTKT